MKKESLFLDELWEGDEEIEDVLDVCYNQSKEILGDKVNEILNYVGLISQLIFLFIFIL